MELNSLTQHLSSCFFKDCHRWPLWSPVFLGSGIALYFSLSHEPSIAWAYGGLVAFCAAVWALNGSVHRLLILAISLIGLGVSVASFRTHLLGTPMLHVPLPSLTLEGTVAQVELKPTQQGTFSQRLLLQDVKADGGEPLPAKIRITLRGKRERLWAGQRIRLKGKLSPVADAALPGEYNFRRQAYFQGIGATGFSLSPPEVIGKVAGWRTTLERRREKITAFFLIHLGFPEGAIAAALITGDKAAIPENVREDFIRSGLAHILAISGLHLTIIAGVIFAITRRSLALIPAICLFYNVKKIAAGGTILITFLYLILSGFGIPAQRAFIMISLVMGAIIIDRTALSLRTVAWAAFLVLFITPEALLGPSFQLSFAAVIGLIAGYEVVRTPGGQWLMHGGAFRKGILYISGCMMTSLLATLATLPFTIYIFHRFSLHALEANIVAVPLTSLIIMPAAFLSCLLAPFDLGGGPLWILEKSIFWLKELASTVGHWPGADISVPQPSLLSFILVVGSGLWLCLWQASWRKWAFAPLIFGGCLAVIPSPPDLLIEENGKLVALYRPPTLYLTSLRRGKFTADVWSRHLAASKTKLLPLEEGVFTTTLRGVPVSIASNKSPQPCLKGAILIRLEPSQNACPQAKLVLDRYDLWRGGSHALWISSDGVKIKKTRPPQGHRPWEKRAVSRKRPGLHPFNSRLGRVKQQPPSNR